MEMILTVIPILLTLILALWTKNIMIALVCGVLSGSIIINGFGFIPPIFDSYIKAGVTGNFEVFIILFSLGPILCSIKRAGGFDALRNAAERKLQNAKQATLMTWCLTVFCGLMADQSLATMGVGQIMRPLTDEHKISREKLGFILTSAGPPMCSFMPYSVFLLFYSGVISGVNPELNGFTEYLKALPYNFYGFASILGALLIAAKIIPDFGPMKKCEQRAMETGAVIREGSHPIETAEIDGMTASESAKPEILTFLIPLLTIVGGVALTYFTTGMVSVSYPVAVGAVVALFYPAIRGFYSAEEIPGMIFAGIKSMVPVIFILILAFAFGQVVTAVGFADTVIALVSKINLDPRILPAIIFFCCCIVAYATGSLMTGTLVFAPIAVVLAMTMDANLSLVIAAALGGSMFGDQTSPLSDMCVQPSMGAGVDVVDLAKAQFVYKALFAFVALICFVAFGYIVG